MLSHFSHIWLFVSLWTVACQAPVSMRFSRQEYWSVLPCPPPRDLPYPGIKPRSLMPPALAGRFFTTSTTWEARKSARDLKIWAIQLSKKWGMSISIFCNQPWDSDVVSLGEHFYEKPGVLCLCLVGQHTFYIEWSDIQVFLGWSWSVPLVLISLLSTCTFTLKSVQFGVILWSHLILC